MIHHILECGWGVIKTKVHDHWFIEAIFCFEYCFVLVSIFDPYLIEGSFYIEFCEDEGILYVCDQLRYEGKWVSIADSPLVNSSVVLYRSLRPVSFPEEEERRRDW